MEKEGVRVSARYPRILAVFGAWFAFGAAIGFLRTQGWFWGGIMIVGGALMIALAIEGSRMKDRTYTRIDIRLQWLTLIFPILFIVMIIVPLATSLLRPFLGYILLYLAGLIVFAALAARELKRGERVG